jgi:hypothetical protein
MSNNENKSNTDRVYLYPKTSCPCIDCSKSFDIPKGPQTNLSVEGCKVSPYFDCHSRVEFGRSVQPREKKGYKEINPQVYLDKQAPYFNPVKCDKNGSCPDITYASWDPRLWSGAHQTYITLDRPPMESSVRLKNVYRKDLDCYGTGYMPYDTIRDGQITYYIDKSREDPFYKPLFATKAQEVSMLYKDPMGAMKPEYNRYPLVNTENPTVTTPEYYPDCLSYIQDTQSHREDLNSLQMRKRNQERWMPRWAPQSTQ